MPADCLPTGRFQQTAARILPSFCCIHVPINRQRLIATRFNAAASPRPPLQCSYGTIQISKPDAQCRGFIPRPMAAVACCTTKDAPLYASWVLQGCVTPPACTLSVLWRFFNISCCKLCGRCMDPYAVQAKENGDPHPPQQRSQASAALQVGIGPRFLSFLSSSKRASCTPNTTLNTRLRHVQLTLSY